MRPTVLVTNDDGIETFFLRLLVEALLPFFEVRVAAPASEQSWIGRAMSRHRAVTVTPWDDLPCLAWAIDGTPSDCVNIALGHLLETPPAVVVSGINLGHNITLPAILSSGTVAGAVEGALAGLPAVAFSQRLPNERFAAIREAKGHVDGALGEAVRAGARHAAAFVATLVGETVTVPVVHNVNFPPSVGPQTPTLRTRPGVYRFGSLYALKADGYRFHFRGPQEIETRPRTDVACIEAGHISHSVLDFSVLGAAIVED